MAAILFSSYLVVIMVGMQDGTYGQNIKMSVEMFTGYLQIQEDDYLENPTLRKSFIYSDEIQEILSNNENIKGFAPRIIADGLIGNSENSFGAAIMALDPEKELTVSNLYKKVNKGKFISKERPYDIVVGEVLLQNLKAKIGDKIVILSSGYDGSMGNMKFRIAGTCKMGQSQFDAMAVFMNIETAKELYSMGDKVSTIAINLDGLDKLEETKAYLETALANIKSTKKIVPRDWMELMPEMQQFIELDDVSGKIFLWVLLAIAAFGIMNTLNMSITERFKEFGVMLALGSKQVSLIVILFIETMIITFVGAFFGLLFGWLTNYYIYLNPIKFTGEMGEMYSEYGWEPAMYSSPDLNSLIYTGISVFIIAVLAYILPAIKLSKLEALKGIRHT
jgi:ABC-type lipoprotein release transport system permease subunit